MDLFIDKMGDNTTMVFLTDHGRGEYRNHGGSTKGEMYTIFGMYQKDLEFRIDQELEVKARKDKLRIVPQISLSATFSALLQTNYPFSNVGSVRTEYLVYNNTSSNFEVNKDLLKTVLLNELQISKYIEYYKSSSNNPGSEIIDIMNDYLKKLDKNKGLLLKMLENIKAENLIDDQHSEGKRTLQTDVDKYKAQSMAQIDELNRRLNAEWSMPQIQFKPYLLVLSMFFLILFAPTLYVANYCSYKPGDADVKEYQTLDLSQIKIVLRL